MKHNLLLVGIITVAVYLCSCYTYTIQVGEFDPFNAGGYCDLSYEIKADPKEDNNDECYRSWKKCTSDKAKWLKSVCGSPCKRKYYVFLAFQFYLLSAISNTIRTSPWRMSNFPFAIYGCAQCGPEPYSILNELTMSNFLGLGFTSARLPERSSQQ